MTADRAGSIISVDNDSVVALDTRGDEQWTARVAGAGLGWPVVSDGAAFVPTLRDEGGPGGCVALDRTSGARVWTYEERDSQGVAVAVAGETVVCALANGVVVALDRATGVRRWRAVFAREAPRSAVAISERTALAVDTKTRTLAFAASLHGGWFVATLDLESGADRGTFDLRAVGPVSAPVSTAPGMLAIGVSGSREVCALDLRERRVGSCVSAPAPEGFDPASIPLVAGHLVVIAARDGSLIAIDIVAGKVAWSVRVPDPILGARPVMAGGVVLFADWSRLPWAVRVSDGSAVGMPKADGWVTSTVADAGGGFEVAERNLDGGWIEHWAPTA